VTDAEVDRLAIQMSELGGLIVISGAGCSTPSGIGDYRDENGEWKRMQPVQHSDFVNHLGWRQRYWARSQLGYPEFIRAKPNEAHHVLARWEASGFVKGVVTQNVDRLHQAAGSRKVIDLHGRLDRVVCLGCGAQTLRDDLQNWLEQHNPDIHALGTEAVLAADGDVDLESTNFADVAVPECQVCAGVLKPDVVFYGDSVPKATVEAAYQWIEKAPAVLVVGSSLMVFSSLRFVRAAHERQTPIYAINRGLTRADEFFQCKLEGDCAEILQALESRLAGR